MFIVAPNEVLDSCYRNLLIFQNELTEYQVRDWDKLAEWKNTVYNNLSYQEKLDAVEPADTFITKTRPITGGDVVLVSMFTAKWDTADIGLGFGPGNLPVYVTVFKTPNNYVVYYDKTLAYKIVEPTQVFFDDIHQARMAGIDHIDQYHL